MLLPWQTRNDSEIDTSHYTNGGEMAAQALEFDPVTACCGAEVRGLDLSQPVEEAAVDALKTGLAEYSVLFFRDQTMTPEQQKTLGRYFGELHVHPAWPRILEGQAA